MSTNRDYLDELNEPLRHAAEEVRADEPPPAAEQRSTERARRTLRGKSAARPRFRRDLLAVAGMAATILFGIVLWNSYRENTPDKPTTIGPVAVVQPKSTTLEGLREKAPPLGPISARSRGAGGG